MNAEEYKIACLDNARHTSIYCRIIYSLLFMLAGSLCCNGYLFYRFMQNAFDTGNGHVTQTVEDSIYSSNIYSE